MKLAQLEDLEALARPVELLFLARLGLVFLAPRDAATAPRDAALPRDDDEPPELRPEAEPREPPELRDDFEEELFRACFAMAKHSVVVGIR